VARLSNKVPGVDPTITAAWISGGVGAIGIFGTAVTAWIGSKSTRKATEQAVEAGADNTRATLAAAREDRLWEKRCAVYEETLAEVQFRSERRAYELRTYRMDKDSEERAEAYFATYETPKSFTAQGRMTAYASDAVLAAYEASRTATLEVILRHGDHLTLAVENRQAAASGNPAAAPGSQATKDARKAAELALEMAKAADDALIKVIRDELRSRPEAAMAPVQVPAPRRRFLRRHRK
jgi:hypothetical protein